MDNPTLNAVVTLRNEVSPWLMILQVAPDRWDLSDFVPGQYVCLGLFGSAPRCGHSESEIRPSAPDKLIRRAYSIASSPVNREFLEFYLNLVPGGALTPRLFNLKIGEERTFEQDPKYAIRLLVDIAIKALSPAINDPTTAVQALNRIEDLLLRLGRRELEIGDFRNRDGQLRLIVPYPAWEDFLRLAFDEIASYGAQSVQVMRRMKALANDFTSRLPQDRHAALHYGKSGCSLPSRNPSRTQRRSRKPRSKTGRA